LAPLAGTGEGVGGVGLGERVITGCGGEITLAAGAGGGDATAMAGTGDGGTGDVGADVIGLAIGAGEGGKAETVEADRRG